MDSVGCKTAGVGHNPRLHGASFLLMSDGVLLRARELAVWRGERCLFEQLQFDLAPQQLALLVGANGSGKTTLLRILAGLAQPTQGSVTWKGIAVSDLPPEERAEVAYRGHLEALKRELTVAENLRFHATLWRREPAFEHLLQELKLDKAAHMRARYLSAGQSSSFRGPSFGCWTNLRRISTAKAAHCSWSGCAGISRPAGSPSAPRTSRTISP